MELCTAQGTSNLPLLQPKHFAPRYVQSQSTLCFKTQFKQPHFDSGLRCHRISSLRCSASDGASTDTSATSSYGGGVTVEEDKSYFPSSLEDTQLKTEEKDDGIKVEDTSDSEYHGAVKREDIQTVEQTEDRDTQVDPEDNGAVKVEDSQILEKTEEKDTRVNEQIKVEVEETEGKDVQVTGTPEEGLSLDVQSVFKLLEDFNIKFDDEDKYPLIVLGSGALVAFWILASVVRAIDSIPLFPKVLELVGIGYSIWFSYRYLIFKEKRDELLTIIQEIKQDVIG